MFALHLLTLTCQKKTKLTAIVEKMVTKTNSIIKKKKLATLTTKQKTKTDAIVVAEDGSGKNNWWLTATIT